jgi:hypothetical protein
MKLEALGQRAYGGGRKCAERQNDRLHEGSVGRVA